MCHENQKQSYTLPNILLTKTKSKIIHYLQYITRFFQNCLQICVYDIDMNILNKFNDLKILTIVGCINYFDSAFFKSHLIVNFAFHNISTQMTFCHLSANNV